MDDDKNIKPIRVTKTELSFRARVPIRTVQYYTDIGLLYHKCPTGKGHGRKRIYTPWSLYQLFIIRDLQKLGMRLSVIKKYLRKYRKDKNQFADLVEKLKNVMTEINNGTFA